MKRQLTIYSIVSVLALGLFFTALKYIVFLVNLIFGLPAPSNYNVTPLIPPVVTIIPESVQMEVCRTVLFTEENGRIFLLITIDGKEFNALLDTGSTASLIDAKSTGVSPDGESDVRDFHGGLMHIKTASLKVCFGGLCDSEDVELVPDLPDKAILRGSFLNRFHTALFDYRARTLALCRREK